MRACLLSAVIFASWGPAPALAADAPPTNALIRQGCDLFKHEDYEGARTAFARAYEIDPRAGVLFDLALAELHSDHPVDAVVHLHDYLTHTGEPAARLESARTKWLPRAQARTARLDVTPAGAQRAVDGAVQKSRPPAAPTASSLSSIAIAAEEPGVRAPQGAVVETKPTADRGGEIVVLHVERVPDVPARAPPVAWVESRKTGASAEAASPRVLWFPVVTLGSGAALAAGLGVGFGLASRSQAAAVRALQSEVAPAARPTECTGTRGSSPYCTRLQSDVDANRLDWTLSAASYVAAGVLAAASLATWLLWKPRSVVAAQPAVTPHSAGAVLDATW